MNVEENKILFVHVPKTAGVALFKTLAEAVGQDKAIRFGSGDKTDQDRYLAMPEDKLREFRLIAGHFILPFFMRKPVQDYKIVTLVRNPVDRELSVFFYIKTWNKHPMHNMMLNKDLYAYLDYRESQLQNRNPQCRFVSGNASFEDAKIAVDNKYFLVAPVEHIEKFYDELSKRLKLNPVKLKRENITKFRLGVHEVHPEIVRRFETLLSDDIKLYLYVKQKFIAEVSTELDSE
jgi:hypothetical protein